MALSSRRCAGARFLYHEVVQVRGERERKRWTGGGRCRHAMIQAYIPRTETFTPRRQWQDPLAELLAGAEIIASERVNQAKNAVYPVVRPG